MQSIKKSQEKFRTHKKKEQKTRPKAERTLIQTNLVGVDEFGLNWSQYAPHQLKLVDLIIGNDQFG